MRRWLIVCCLGLAAAMGAGRGARAAPAATDEQQAAGAELYSRDCAVCHGPQGKGTERGPDITTAGLAAVDFQLQTGRMPRAAVDSGRETPRYDQEQIDAVLAYTTAFISGPAIPTVDIASASLGNGQRLFAANCAACHQSVGSGGVLAYDVNVPSLRDSSPTEVAEAMRTGPGQMPVFGPDSFTDSDVADVAAYVQVLHDPDDRGGFGLGHFGPVPEGLVAVAVGLFAMVGVARLLGTREAQDES